MISAQFAESSVCLCELQMQTSQRHMKLEIQTQLSLRNTGPAERTHGGNNAIFFSMQRGDCICYVTRYSCGCLVIYNKQGITSYAH